LFISNTNQSNVLSTEEDKAVKQKVKYPNSFKNDLARDNKKFLKKCNFFLFKSLLELPSLSVSLEKCMPRPVWVVNEKKINEGKPKELSPEEMIEAFNSQGHVNA
jgi:hypothetical protein